MAAVMAEGAAVEKAAAMAAVSATGAAAREARVMVAAAVKPAKVGVKPAKAAAKPVKVTDMDTGVKATVSPATMAAKATVLRAVADKAMPGLERVRAGLRA